MNNKRNRGGRNPKLDPATNRYSVNFSSEEDMRFLKMFDRSGMTSKSAFIKARIFGEPFHVVIFDKTAALMYKLEKCMMQLVQVMSKVTELTDEYREKLQKSEEKGNKVNDKVK